MKMVLTTDEGWRLNKRMKPFVAVNSILDAITNGMKNNVRRCLKDSPPDTTIPHFGINNLDSNETAEELASHMMNLKTSLQRKIKLQ